MAKNNCENCGFRARYEYSPSHLLAVYGGGTLIGALVGKDILPHCRMKTGSNLQKNTI